MQNNLPSDAVTVFCREFYMRYSTRIMQIELSPSDQQKLAQQAAAHGYESVEDYALQLLSEAVQEINFAEDAATLSETELQASLAECDRSMAQMDEGRSLTVEQAHQRSIQRLTGNPPQ